MNTTITRTFAAAALPLVHAQIAKAVKLATRLGAPQPLVTISDVYQAETGRSNQITGVKITKAVFDADITIAPLQYNGWTLRARIEHDARIGTLVHCVPGQSVPEAYRSAAPTCDHCQAKRARKDTFVLQHDDGRWFRVGRQCVADFLGHSVNFYFGERILGELNDDAFWDGLGRIEPSYSVADELVPLAAGIITEIGFISRKSAEIDGGTTTSSLLMVAINPTDERSLRGDPITYAYGREHLKPSELAARAWVAAAALPTTFVADFCAYWANVAARNEFEDNCQKIVATKEITTKHFGLFAAAVFCYFRHLGQIAERTAKPAAGESHYVGEVGKREVFSGLTCTKVISLDTDFGTLHINKLLDAAGNIIVWKTGSHRLAEGETYTGKCTVKKHDAYKGIKQTIVSRCALQQGN